MTDGAPTILTGLSEHRTIPFPYKRILCPVDFDDNSLHAVEQASALSGGFASCTLSKSIRSRPRLRARKTLRPQEKYAREKLDQITEERLAGVECEILIERGNPADVILAMEETVAPDLVGWPPTAEEASRASS